MKIRFPSRTHCFLILFCLCLTVGLLAFLFIIKRGLVKAATLSLSTPGTTIQIDVPNRYRAIITTVADDHIVNFYDRAENDSTPDLVLQLEGYYVQNESILYAINQDVNRKTTILESTATRVKIRIEGGLSTSGGTYLTDGTNKILITDEFTFTTEGAFENVTVDYKTGVAIDNVALDDHVMTQDVKFNIPTTSYHSETIYYGDGNTESFTSTTADISTTTDIYGVFQGTGTYQDMIIGEMTKNGDKVLSNSNNGLIRYVAASYQDEFKFYDLRTQTLRGKGSASLFYLFKAQADLETETLREGVFNDLTNPDFLTFTTGSSWDFTKDSDLEGLWYMESDGSTAETDQSTRGNNLTVSASDTIPRSTDARQGTYSRDFEDDDDDYLYIADTSMTGLAITGKMTALAWIRSEALTSDYMNIMSRIYDTGNNRAWYLVTMADGTLRARLNNDGNTGWVDPVTTAASAITTNTWYHVAMVYDGAYHRLYINGQARTDGSGPIAYTGVIYAGTADFVIGNNENHSATQQWDGLIDEAAVFSRALSPSEIKQIFSQGLSTHYNEAEGTYTVDASSNEASLDIDGQTDISTLLNGVVTAGATTITVDSTTTFPASGVAYVDGDKFSYSGKTETTFTGVPASGELSVVSHADNTVVSSMNRHDPFFKIRNYRSNTEPSSIGLEGATLADGTDYNLDYKPVSSAYWAQDLLWYSTMENAAALSTPDVGTAITNGGATYVVGKYGNGLYFDADADTLGSMAIGSNFNTSKGAVEFWYKPSHAHTDNAEHRFLEIWNSTDWAQYIIFRKNSDNTLAFQFRDSGAVIYSTTVASSNYSWTAGDWVHLKATWDEDAAVADQIRIYINGVEPTHTYDTDNYTDASLTVHSLWISGTSGTTHADGILDEYRIYGGQQDNPVTLAKGGNTADADEHLARTDVNETLSFVEKTSTEQGEYLFLGSDSMVSGFNIDLATNGVSVDVDLDWEYWNGTSWANLESITGFTDGTSNLTQDGAVYWTNIPTNWRPYSVNGSTDLYYIRVSMNYNAGIARSYSTSPIENTIRTDIINLQYLHNITANDQTFTSNIVIPTSTPTPTVTPTSVPPSATPTQVPSVISLSSPSATTYQIDVPNRYTAVMDTADTVDYIIFKDRVQSDGSPPTTHEIKGPCITETAVYCLRDDANRKTTILESTATRIRIRVEGGFNNEAGTAYLAQGATGTTTPNLTVREDYTFTPDGMFVENKTDFGTTGEGLDADSGHNGYEWLGVWADVDSTGFDEGVNPDVIYGDGNTEVSSNLADDAEFAKTNTYVVLAGTGTSTYQDAFVGIAQNGWFDDAAASVQEWRWDEGNDGTQDLLTAQEQNYTPVGIHYAKWYLLLQTEVNLNSEGKRESMNNDYRNPDILTYSTGSEWDDAPASPGLKFDNTNDGVSAVNSASIQNLQDNAFTVETWFYWPGIAASAQDIALYKANGWQLDFADWGSGDVIEIFVPAATTAAETDYNISTLPNLENSWHHLAFRFDDASTRTIDLLIDGVLVTTTQRAAVGAITNDSANKVFIGCSGTTGSCSANYYNGMLDEIRVWNDWRTDAEIASNMYKQLDPATENNLVAYWRLNENTGTVAHDETTNNNDGTIAGASWQTGFVPDYYNEAEGAYTVAAWANQAYLDINGQADISTLLNGAATAGSATITVDSTTTFPASGVAYIDGDKFSYTGTTATTFTGVPASGELSVIGHADNSVVSSMNRHKPFFKIKNFRSNTEPSPLSLEDVPLTDGTDYNLDFKPVSSAYWAQDLTWYSTMQSSTAFTSPDVGVGTSSSIDTATFVAGKYGNGMQIDATTENPYFVSSGNISGSAGTVEFWYINTTAPAASGYFFACDNGSGTVNMSLGRGGNATDIDFIVNDGSTHTNSWDGISVSIYDGSWHHIKLTYDAATDVPDLYLDGILQIRDATSAWNAITPQTNTYIGNNSGTNHIGGIIDEFRIYDAAATPVTIAKGGNTADASEYLGRTNNNYTLSFAPKITERGEYLFFGSDSMFSGLNIDLATLGTTAGSLNLDWEYWNGTAWADLEAISGFTDGTSNLTQDGAVYWTNIPTNWRLYSVNGSTDLYYIRVSLNSSSGTYTASPVENTIWTDVLLVQLLSNISLQNQTFICPRSPLRIEKIKFEKIKIN